MPSSNEICVTPASCLENVSHYSILTICHILLTAASISHKISLPHMRGFLKIQGGLTKHTTCKYLACAGLIRSTDKSRILSSMLNDLFLLKDPWQIPKDVSISSHQLWGPHPTKEKKQDPVFETHGHHHWDSSAPERGKALPLSKGLSAAIASSPCLAGSPVERLPGEIDC